MVLIFIIHWIHYILKIFKFKMKKFLIFEFILFEFYTTIFYNFTNSFYLYKILNFSIDNAKLRNLFIQRNIIYLILFAFFLIFGLMIILFEIN